MSDSEFSDRDLAQILWNYNFLRQDIRPADFIFVMCSYNLRVADRAFVLFQKNYGDFIAVSGGVAHQDDLLATGWDKPEAVIFTNRLVELGFQKNDLIVEKEATNCGENIIFTKKMFAQNNLNPKTGLIVQKPYMERRAYATACQQWPEVDWQVTSPELSYDEYTKEHQENRLINIMVGDTWRIRDYAEKGYQIKQDIPDQVEKAMKELINRGYDKHIKE